jgi:hypothetical protein
MGDPEDALFASMAMRDLAATAPVRLGVNLGPVRLVKDLNGQMNIIGDGINVAQRVMSFARPGQLLVSRSFYEVVSCLSRDYASLFRHEGSRTDKHVRAHEVYAVVGATPQPRRLDAVEARTEAPAGSAGWLSGSGPLGFRRSALLAAPLAFLLIVAGGVAARAMIPEAPAPKAAAPAKPVAALPLKPAVALAPTAPGPAAPAPAVPAPEAAPPTPSSGGGAAGGIATPEPPKPVVKKLAARVEKKAESPRPEKVAAAGAAARIELAVAPWGEILVDGKSRGVSPPLRVLELPPGAHTIEIRNTTFPAHVARVEVKPGQAIRIQHRFR